jgi:hypothetical protein
MRIKDYLEGSDKYLSEEEAEGAYMLDVEASPMHLAIVEMLRGFLESMEIMSGGGSSQAGAVIRTMGRSLKMMEPTLIEGFVDVPPQEVEAFMLGLMERMQGALDKAHAAIAAPRSNKSSAA